LNASTITAKLLLLLLEFLPKSLRREIQHVLHSVFRHSRSARALLVHLCRASQGKVEDTMYVIVRSSFSSRARRWTRLACAL
jgi:hypothetical protein